MFGQWHPSIFPQCSCSCTLIRSQSNFRPMKYRHIWIKRVSISLEDPNTTSKPHHDTLSKVHRRKLVASHAWNGYQNSVLSTFGDSIIPIDASLLAHSFAKIGLITFDVRMFIRQCEQIFVLISSQHAEITYHFKHRSWIQIKFMEKDIGSAQVISLNVQ